MKGSLFLTILIAFCAVQGDGASTSEGLSTSEPPTTSGSSAPTTVTSGSTSKSEPPTVSSSSVPTTVTSGSTSKSEPPTVSSSSVPTTVTSGSTSKSEPPTVSSSSVPTTVTSGSTSKSEPPTVSSSSVPTTVTSGSTSKSEPPTVSSSSVPTTVTSGSTSKSEPPTVSSSSAPTTVTSGSTSKSEPPTVSSSSAPTTVTSGSTSKSEPPTVSSSSAPTTVTSGSTSKSEPPTVSSSSVPTTVTSGSTSKSEPPTVSSSSAPTTVTSGSTSKSEPPTVSSSSAPTTVTSGSTSKSEPPTVSSSSAPTTVTSGSTSKSEPPTVSSSSAPATVTSGSTSTSEPPTTSSSSAPATDTTGGPATSASKATDMPLTTQGSTPCAIQPCKYGATCINLLTERVCQCPYGFFYGLSGCQQGKIFPGQLQLNVPYVGSMQIISSSTYQELYNNVTQFFNNTFENYTDYEQTVLVSVQQSPSRRLLIARATPDVKIINIFVESTDLTENNVTAIIQSADKTFVKSFKSATQCDVYGCDENTAECIEPKDAHQFPTCNCISDLAKKNPEDKACLLCNDQCTSENHKQCFQKEGGVPSCICQPDYYEVKDRKCERCSFGFSGKDCSNNFLAILVGVAVACGVVIIVLTGVLIYKSLRAKKDTSSETRSLLNSDFSSTGRVPENNYATNVNTREKIFPRVQAKNPTAVNKTVMDSQGGQARNTQEPGIANKAYIPERDYDDDDNPWLEMSTRGKF